MTEHTPGPWGVDFTQSLDGAVIVQTDTGMCIGEAYYLGVHDGQPDGAVNARFIAAGPDMLEALEVTVKRFMDEGYDSTNFEEAIDAIAKARGE